MLLVSAREYFRLLGILGYEKEHQDGYGHCTQTFNDEDPAPALLALDAVHSADTVGEQSAYQRAKYTKRKEHCESYGLFFARVVLAEEQCCNCGHDCFEEAHQEAAGKQTAVRMGEPLTHGHDTQDEHCRSHEDIGLDTRKPHDQIGGDAHYDEGDEEYPETGVEAIAGHVEPLLQAFDPRIGNCITLNMSS